jgi:hypothetical protein
VRNTFRNLNGIGGSVIDFIFVNNRVLPRVVDFDCSFTKPCNHAQMNLSLRIDNYTPGEADKGNQKRVV